MILHRISIVTSVNDPVISTLVIERGLHSIGRLCQSSLMRVDRKIQFLTSVIPRTCGCIVRLMLMVRLPYEQDQDQGVLVVPKGLLLRWAAGVQGGSGGPFIDTLLWLAYIPNPIFLCQFCCLNQFYSISHHMYI